MDNNVEKEKQIKKLINTLEFKNVQKAFARLGSSLAELSRGIITSFNKHQELEKQKKQKYKKRVENRQRLYEKMKKLGRN